MYKNTTRKQKRKMLLIKLYNELSKIAGIKPKLRIAERIIHSCYFKPYYNLISLNILNIEYRTKMGYASDYYSFRAEKLAFCKGNKKLMYRFTLLHELFHAIQYAKGIIYNIEKPEREKQADDYAIAKLKEYNLLKDNKVKFDYFRENIQCFKCNTIGHLVNGVFTCIDCGNKGFKTIKA